MAYPDPARVKQIVAAALDRPPAERDAFVAGACTGDPALLGEVLSLLAAMGDASADRFLAGVSTRLSEPQEITETAGSRIGPYKLLQKIGEGGFGVVFLAEQEKPVRRKVALKIIKPGMDSKQIIGRFEAERQVLALMDHPHIARVFDGGLTESQRPFFVMEYVIGDPVNAFADMHKLALRERLDLFQQVCNAVQHAHTKGIIHRDLKPGNVLVSMTDGKPFAKVIDFGIAKATGAAGGRLSDVTFFTEHKQLIGTPEYMSPEQVEGSPDIDTRTDVYALGVLLYELLTGLTPFDRRRLRSAALAEMQRIIKEEEPIAPSVRLQKGLATPRRSDDVRSESVARAISPSAADTVGPVSNRSSSPPSSPPSLRRSVASSLSAKAVRGELDWIVLKALEKDRARRYESPSHFAADVQRHLSGEPVVAARPSLVYRVRKFVQKHRTAVVSTSLVAAALVLGLVTTTWQWRVAQSEWHRAEENAVLSQQAASLARAREREAEAATRFAASVRREAEHRRSIESDRLRELEVAAQRESNTRDRAAELYDASRNASTPTAFDLEFSDLPVIAARRLASDQMTVVNPDAEHHAAGIHHGYERIDDLVVGPRADIRVDRPGKTVVLWLSSYFRVSWHVVATPTTRVTAIVLLGQGRQRVCSRIDDLSVIDATNMDIRDDTRSHDPHTFDCCYAPYTASFDRFMLRMRTLSQSPLVSFSGSYDVDCRAPILVDGSKPLVPVEDLFPRPSAFPELSSIRFGVVVPSPDSDESTIQEFSIHGPTGRELQRLPFQASTIVYDSKMATALYLAQPKVQYLPGGASHTTGTPDVWVFRDGSTSILNPGWDVPVLSWPSGLAYDTKHDRFLVTSVSGEGYLYEIDNLMNWRALRSFDNWGGLTCLAYDPSRDVFHGIPYKSGHVVTLDSAGREIDARLLKGDIVPGCLQNAQLFCVQHTLIAVNFQAEDDDGDQVPRTAIHVISPTDGTVRIASYGWRL